MYNECTHQKSKKIKWIGISSPIYYEKFHQLMSHIVQIKPIHSQYNKDNFNKKIKEWTQSRLQDKSDSCISTLVPSVN